MTNKRINKEMDKPIGEEALEAIASVGESKAKLIAFAFTLLPHSR